MDRAIVLKRACDLSSDILFRISESEGVEVWDPLCTGTFLAGDCVLYRRIGLFSHHFTFDGIRHEELQSPQ